MDVHPGTDGLPVAVNKLATLYLQNGDCNRGVHAATLLKTWYPSLYASSRASLLIIPGNGTRKS